MATDPVYYQVSFDISPLHPVRDTLIAELSELPFDTFLETETGLQAFVESTLFDANSLEASVHFPFAHSLAQKLDWSIAEVVQENWNAKWESDFKPIVVGDRVSVIAPFHEPISATYELVIAPKMSFGTGHHQTTYQMLDYISQTDFSDKRLLDMGCGTSILSILAAKMGAECDAIDIDAWCIENSLENAERNGVKVNVWQAENCLDAHGTYDMILANINRNVLLDQVGDYRSKLKSTGSLWVSGFYLADLDVIKTSFADFNFELVDFTVLDQWVAAKFIISSHETSMGS